MNRLCLTLLSFVLVAGCKPKDATPTHRAGVDPRGSEKETATLPEARKGFVTKHTRHKADEPVPEPPAKVFRKVTYDAPVGKCAAYLTPDPGDGKKRPAIVWITGGDCNTIGDVWSRPKPNNDQTARQYREAGVVMMFPSLRGGNDNPGFQEGFFGEVDDVIAAAEFLAKQPHVDPKRIYLGGHSTGGTLVMLVAASTNKFRGVFSFGPVHDVRGYGGQFAPFDQNNDREFELRAPGRWLHSIQCPTFAFEGDTDGNLLALLSMKGSSQNPKAHFLTVKGVDHFSILAPVNRLIAQKILKDDAAATNLAFTEDEVNQAAKR